MPLDQVVFFERESSLLATSQRKSMVAKMDEATALLLHSISFTFCQNPLRKMCGMWVCECAVPHDAGALADHSRYNFAAQELGPRSSAAASTVDIPTSRRMHAFSRAQTRVAKKMS